MEHDMQIFSGKVSHDHIDGFISYHPHETTSATEAFRLGLIERIVQPGRVMEVALELAAKVIEKGPLGVVAGKKVINGARDLSLEQGLELESDLWADLTTTEDVKEGARAFIEKRKPEYKGT